MSSANSVREQLLKKYGSANGTEQSRGNGANTGNKGSVREQLLNKYSEDSVQQRIDAVSDWANRYNTVVNGIYDYRTKLGDGYTADSSGGFGADLESLIRDYDTIGDYAGRMGMPNAQRYLNQLREIQKNIQDYDAYMAQFSGEEDYAQKIAEQEAERQAYEEWLKSDEYAKMRADQKAYDALRTLNQGDAQKEIEELEKKRSEMVSSRRPNASSYLTGGTEVAGMPYAAAKGGVETDRELAELDAQISQKKQYLNRAKRVQKGEALAGVADPTSGLYDADFSKLSRYASTEKETPQWWENSVGDTQYEWINNQGGFRDTYEKDMSDLTRLSGGNWESQYLQKNYDKLTEQEVGIYNYYYAKYGREKAQEYLDNIQESLNYRAAEERFAGMENQTGLELLFGMEAGLDQFKGGMSALFNTEDDYIAQSAVQIASGMVREDLADAGATLPKWLGGGSVGQMAYDAVTTTANMAPSILVSMGLGMLNPVAGELAGTALMGASAAGNAYQEALNQGYDKGQARTYSALIGGSEAGLQYLLGGLGKLGGKLSGQAITKALNGVDNAFLRFAGKLGGNMLSEGFEEGLQEILTPMFKNMALHTDEDINWGEVAYSALLGSVTAFGMEGINTASGELGIYNTGRQLKDSGVTAQRLAEIGSTFSADTVAAQLAGRVDKNTGAYTLGRLFNEIGASLSEQNVSDIRQALVQEGIPENIAEGYARVVEKFVDGTPIDERMVSAIEEDTLLARAMKTALIDKNTTWYQRSEGYKDVLKQMAKQKVSQTEQSAPGQENTPAADTVGATADVASESAPAADTTPAKMHSIASIQNGKVTVRMEDGTEVAAEKADLDPETGVIVKTIGEIDGISQGDANFLLGMLKDNPAINPQLAALGAKEAYRYGVFGIAEEHIAKHGVFTEYLTEQQRKRIYETGREAGKRQTAEKQAEITKKAATEKSSTAGKVHFEGERSALTERQSASLSAMETVADALGVQIYVFESKVNERGKHIGANGWYDSKDGSIHIDLHAGANGEGTMLFTLAHELTHYIRQWSPAKFKALADFLMEEYGKKGVNVDGLIRDQIAKAKRGGRTISYDTAYEEVVADAMETMLADGAVLEKLEKLKAQDKSLWQKIRDFINEWASKIRSVYDGLKPDSVEGRYVAEMAEAVEKLQELFAEGLVEASENAQVANGQKNTTPEDGGEKYQARRLTQEDLGDYLSAGNRKNKNKAAALEAGHKIILTSKQEITDFIDGAIDKKLDSNTTVAYGKVNDRLAQDVLNVSGGQIRIKDNYLELIPDNLQHAFEQHSVAKQEGDIDLSRDDFESIPEYLDSYTEVVYAIEYSSGKVGVCVSKKLPNGRILLIETVSKSRGALQFKNAIGVSEEKYKTDYIATYKKRAETNTRGSEGSKYSLRDSFNSTDSIRSGGENVKYQERDTEAVSNRSLLANAFEGVAQNEWERKKIQEYRENIGKMNAEEQKLRELKAQIKELSFAKGPRDKTKLSALRDEATMTANRISNYDRMLLRLEASGPLQSVLEREKQKAYREAEEKGKAALDEYRESAKKSIDSRHRTAIRNKLRKVVRELDKILNRGTKERNVKEGMRGFAAEALSTAEFLFSETTTDEDIIRSGFQFELLNEEQEKAYREAYDILKRLDGAREGSMEEKELKNWFAYRRQKLKDALTKERMRRESSSVEDVLNSLAEAYIEMEESEYAYIAKAVDDEVYVHIKNIAKKLKGAKIAEMTAKQLQDVYDAYTMVLTTIRNVNKGFKLGKGSITDTAGQVKSEIEKQGSREKVSSGARRVIEKLDWNNLKPIYAIDRIGSETLSELFGNVRKGEDTWVTDITEARDFREERTRKYHFDKWDFSSRHEFESTAGKKFSLDLEQIMSIYAYSKRKQADKHLLKGGIVFAPNTELVTKNKRGKEIKKILTDATAYNLSPETQAEIISKLTDEQKAYVDEMRDYLSDVMGGKGNEVSMEMYGVKLFREKFYFPLKSSHRYMETAEQQAKGNVKIKNSGFAKEVVPEASNPIVLEGFSKVWASHVNEMSMYHAFVLPMEDFYRVFNFKTKNDEIAGTESMKSVIENVHGAAAVSYIEQLLDDINGGAVSDPRESMMKSLVSKHKKAATMASLSVFVQQPTAIIRAMALIDPKYFKAKGAWRSIAFGQHKKLWEEAKQYAPVAAIKEMGYFDTNMGRTAGDILTAKKHRNLWEKLKDSTWRDDILSRPAAWADEAAWDYIWYAAKLETMSRNPNLSPQSEQFLKLAGERFTEVVTKTQVYDSVLSRSANMRSKSLFMNMFTSFMAEPTTSINMIEDAFTNGDMKQKIRTVSAVFGAAVLNAALVSVVYAMRDDDEEKTFTEKYLARLATEILDGINPLTYLPFVKDVWSVMQGYEVERADMTLISDAVDALKQLISEYSKDTDDMNEEELDEHMQKLKNGWWDVADVLGSFLGFPLRNIRRDVNSVFNTAATLNLDRSRETTGLSLRHAVKAEVKKSTPVWGWLPGETKTDKLYDAVTGNDAAYVERLRKSYKEDSSYASAVRKALRENDSRIWQAAVFWNEGNNAEYMRIAKEIVGEKHFEQDDVVLAIRAEANAMEEKKNSSSEEKVYGYFTAEKFGQAVVQGNEEMEDVIRKDMIDTAVANGKTEREAEKSFNSDARSAMKELWLEGKLTDEAAVKAMADFCGNTEEEARQKVAEWAFVQENGFNYDEKAQQFKAGKITGEKLKAMLMETGGMSAEEAEADVVSYSRDAYEEGYFSRKQTAEMMIRYGGLTEEEAEDKLRYLDFKMDNPGVYADDSWIDQYYAEVENSGISIDMYVAYRDKSKGQNKNDKMSVIDSLPISDAQKDALYYAEGWAESKIWQAPWH